MSDKKPRNLSVTEQLINIGKDNCSEFFLDEYGRAFAVILFKNSKGKDAKKIIPIDSRDFSDFLARKETEMYKKGAYISAINTACATFRGEALQKPREKMYLRCALLNNEIIYNFGNSDGEYAIINSNGYCITTNPPVKFYASSEQVLPEVYYVYDPEKYSGDEYYERPMGETIEEYCKRFNLNNKEADRHILKVKIVANFLDEIVTPLSLFTGSAGSAKTSACVKEKVVVDPRQGFGLANNTIALPRSSKLEEDMPLHFIKNYFPVYDNVSKIDTEQSDMLCRGVTGGSIQTRTLFTNGELYEASFKRKIGLNGIGVVPRKSDLMDRTLIFELERINDFISETELEQETKALMPYVLDDVFSILALAMQVYPEVKKENETSTIRQIDFFVWGEAISRAMGYEPDLFLKRYAEKKNNQDKAVIENDFVAKAVKRQAEIMRENGIEKIELSPTDLLKTLKELAGNDADNLPKTANWLTSHLTEIAPNLELSGVSIKHRNITNNVKCWTITLKGDEIDKK